MFKFITITALFCYCFGSNWVRAQRTDIQLFELTCDAIAQQNEWFVVKESLAGSAVLIEDPVAGAQAIIFKGDTTKDVVRNFRKLDMAGQLKILTNESLPVFPLRDSLLIIDTLNFFEEGLHYRSGKCFFKVIRRADKRNKEIPAVYLSALGYMPENKRKEDFYLCFAFSGHRLWSYCYFSREEGRYTISRTSLSGEAYCSGG